MVFATVGTHYLKKNVFLIKLKCDEHCGIAKGFDP